MATHSSTLAWRIPWTEEPGRLQSMGLQRVRHKDMTERLSTAHNHIKGSSGSSAVRNLPAMQQTQVQFLGREDSLEKETATHSSILPHKILQTEEPGGLYSPRNSPGQNTGVGSLSLLQGIFPTQVSNPGLLHCRLILYQLSHQASPRILEWVDYPFSSQSSQPRGGTRVFCIAGRFFTH